MELINDLEEVKTNELSVEEAEKIELSKETLKELSNNKEGDVENE